MQSLLRLLGPVLFTGRGLKRKTSVNMKSIEQKTEQGLVTYF